MKSHTYTMAGKDFVGLAWPLLIPLAVFAAAMHGGALAGFLPHPRPALDMDRTIIIHQIEASRRSQRADIVLLGDSSCLMDVSAPELSAVMGRPVLNLGMISFLGLPEYGALLRAYAATNPGRPLVVVLLMHPNSLRLATTEPYHQDVFRHFVEGRDYSPTVTLCDQLCVGLGLEIFRGRILARTMPAPLREDYGRYYGFVSSLEDYMTRHGGSAVEPVKEKLQGSSEYRLGRGLESPSRAFRSFLPPGTRLVAGLTPVAESLARRDYAAVHEAMLNEWCGWLGAEPLKIRATMPDELFGRPAHLDERGGGLYSRELGGVLGSAVGTNTLLR